MSAIDFKDRLAEAVSLRESGKPEDARERLVALQRERPDDPAVNLQCAWALDKLGREREAVPFYEKAIELGLEGDDLKGALLGLGSTYRALGEYGNSLSTLTRGVESFPEDRSLQVFQAMALYNNGRSKEACELLLAVVAATTADPVVGAYRGAIETYAADLDRTWS